METRRILVVGVIAAAVVAGGATLFMDEPQPISQNPDLTGIPATTSSIVTNATTGETTRQQVDVSEPSTLLWDDLYTGMNSVPDKSFLVRRDSMARDIYNATYTYGNWTVRGHWKVFPEGAITQDQGTSLILAVLDLDGSSNWFSSEVWQNITIEEAGQYQVRMRGLNPSFELHENTLGCVDIGTRLYVRQDGNVVAEKSVERLFSETETITVTLPVDLEPGEYQFGVEAYGLEDGCGLPLHEKLLVSYLALER